MALDALLIGQREVVANVREEHRHGAVVVHLGDGVELVVVAARAVHRQAEEHPPGRRDHVIEVVVAVLRVVLLAEEHARPHAQHPGRDQRVKARVFYFVAGELLLHEAVVGLVLVECLDDVIAVTPSVRLIVVVLIAGGIRVAHRIQPVASPAFAVTGRVQQFIDQPCEGFLRRVLLERGHDCGRRQQADQIQVGSPHQRPGVGARSALDALIAQASGEERVDGMCFAAGRSVSLGILEGPPDLVFLSLFLGDFPRCARVDPTLQRCDFLRGECAAKRHARLGGARYVAV